MLVFFVEFVVCVFCLMTQKKEICDFSATDMLPTCISVGRRMLRGKMLNQIIVMTTTGWT